MYELSPPMLFCVRLALKLLQKCWFSLVPSSFSYGTAVVHQKIRPSIDILALSHENIVPLVAARSTLVGLGAMIRKRHVAHATVARRSHRNEVMTFWLGTRCLGASGRWLFRHGGD